MKRVVIVLVAVCLLLTGCGVGFPVQGSSERVGAEDIEKPESVEQAGDAEEADNTEQAEDVEGTEQAGDAEETDNTEQPEDMADSGSDGLGRLDGLKNMDIRELANNWPESITYDADGVWASPLFTTMEMKQPVTLSITCVTLDGRLQLKIVNQDTEEVCFNEKNPDGTYEVKLDQAGTYQVLFYAREHVGSVEIVPEN